MTDLTFPRPYPRASADPERAQGHFGKLSASLLLSYTDPTWSVVVGGKTRPLGTSAKTGNRNSRFRCRRQFEVGRAFYHCIMKCIKRVDVSRKYLNFLNIASFGHFLGRRASNF